MSQIPHMPEHETSSTSFSSEDGISEKMESVAKAASTQNIISKPEDSGPRSEAPSTRAPSGRWEEIENVAKIHKLCGNVCDTDRKPDNLKLNEGNWGFISKEFRCMDLFKNSQFYDKGASPFLEKPMAKLPPQMMKHYTYRGRVRVKDNLIKRDFKLSQTTYHWSKDQVEANINLVRKGDMNITGSYSADDNVNIMKAIKAAFPLEGKRVLVIGSMSPWLESIALAQGANELATLEYAHIQTDHPMLSSFTPNEFISAFLNKSLEPFDAMMTFSSLEHSGLGRYGDGLNPWGDLIAMARTHCVLKENARVLVGVQGCEIDTIFYNAHRCYGPLMFSHLLSNFELKYISHPHLEKAHGDTHVVVVAQKMEV